MKSNTIQDIANKAGVSITTVSRALNPSLSHLVKKDTKESIFKVVKKYDYRPSEIAQILASGKSRYIGILLPIVSNSIFYNDYYLKFFKGVIEAVRDARYRLHVLPLDIEKDKDLCVKNVLENPLLEGVIISPEIGHFYFPIERLVNHRIPSVIVSDYKKNLELNFVYSDNYAGGCLVGNYLAKKKLTKIVMLKGRWAAADIHDREKGYKHSLTKNRNIKFEKTIEISEPNEAYGYNATKELLNASKANRPDVIFATNDEMAIGALKAISQSKLKCPKDIKVIGYDGLDVGIYTNPPLTTVDQRISDLAVESVKTLVDRLEGKWKESAVKKIKPKLTERESC